MTAASEANLFEAAVRLATPGERAAFLDRECADHPALRQRLEALLEAHEETEGPLSSGREAGDTLGPGSSCAKCGTELRAIGGRMLCPRCFHDSTLTEADPDKYLSQPEGVGESIGPYKLLEKIGEGGFGIVYMAEQSAPVRRRVALKVIKLGMDTREVIARFEAERQALAMMDHPNIAKVLDAGSTHSEDGRPYFVMELREGNSHHRVLRQEPAQSTRERLELFILVCAGLAACSP